MSANNPNNFIPLLPGFTMEQMQQMVIAAVQSVAQQTSVYLASVPVAPLSSSQRQATGLATIPDVDDGDDNGDRVSYPNPDSPGDYDIIYTAPPASPGNGYHFIEIEVRDYNQYSKMQPMKLKARQVAKEFSLRESPEVLPWLISRQHELGLILTTYRDIRSLMLDFGITPSALEPGNKTVFGGLSAQALLALEPLTLRFEPALEPVRAPQELFFVTQSSAVLKRFPQLKSLKIILHSDPRSRKVRLRNENQATCEWIPKCLTFPHTRMEALALLMPNPKDIATYVENHRRPDAVAIRPGGKQDGVSNLDAGGLDDEGARYARRATMGPL
ncbi:hypothetical protein QFC21_002201 [Naganishia friedmannii]|uniref:Uncharacterized protein n=1 Tax=Naganishia friedmannii TaxID=89922 RepID=A0ACC2VY70_9TREE|nr:hypothetical protein QFC21_002201 [Naganishia friedmannii]